MEFIVIFLLLIFILAVMLSPLETLTWWAGWFGAETADSELPATNQPLPDSPYQHYVVYLTGIGGFSNDKLLDEERALLDRLIDELPDVRIVDDVYPYALAQWSLTEGRLLSRFWRFAVMKKMERRAVGFIINIRNMLQVFVAADRRYSPIYSEGISESVLRGLKRHGYPVSSGVPVTLIGYSGGGEIAISTITPLKRAINAPVYVISLAGVMSDDPYVADVEHLYHIYGERDTVQLLGSILFPGRWRWAKWSVWNRARAAGKITPVLLGDMTHNGVDGYLDMETRMEDGRAYFDATVAKLADLIRSIYQ
jgi:hypothetical protein